MFISKARLLNLERLAGNAEYELKRLNDRYWELWHEMALIKSHLGVYIEEIPGHRELRTKGGPEKG